MAESGVSPHGTGRLWDLLNDWLCPRAVLLADPKLILGAFVHSVRTAHTARNSQGEIGEF